LFPRTSEIIIRISSGPRAFLIAVRVYNRNPTTVAAATMNAIEVPMSTGAWFWASSAGFSPGVGISGGRFSLRFWVAEISLEKEREMHCSLGKASYGTWLLLYAEYCCTPVRLLHAIIISTTDSDYGILRGVVMPDSNKLHDRYMVARWVSLCQSVQKRQGVASRLTESWM
jgi:hypothetical protein